jgi:methyl-accepting chemotaxis protein
LDAVKAAKNTGNLIAHANDRIRQAVSLNQEVEALLEKNSALGGQVGTFVGDISSASGEQAQGIRQITDSVAEMEKVVQQNAANAEENAAAAQQMNSQAMHMKAFIRELTELIQGRGQGRINEDKVGATSQPFTRESTDRGSEKGPAKRSSRLPGRAPKEPKWEPLLPLDNAELKGT